MKNAANIHNRPTLQQVIEQSAISRRGFLKGLAICAGGVALSTSVKSTVMAGSSLSQPVSSLGFKEIAKRLDGNHAIAENYQVTRVISWGDSLVDTTPFVPEGLSAQTQQQRFGYNNDFIAYMPIERGGTQSEHGLLCVNHEYTNRYMMFPGLTQATEQKTVNLDQSKAEMQAHGCSVIEVKKENGQWIYVPGSRYNRRITATTPMKFSGPAAGHKDLRTSYDKEGLNPIGTMSNCAGGVTPWGTVLTAEENFDYHFSGIIPESHKDAYERYEIGAKHYYHWHLIDNRFDYGKEPNEPNRLGWIVEYDPYDPTFVPMKRTALGRFKHECATTHINPDGRIVVYSGDDEEFEYVYRFVSKGKFEQDNLAHNLGLLDEGELSVARFYEDGMMEWLPLVYGQQGLDESNGFSSQAEVLIYARKAADIIGATPMDRPEDVEMNPKTGSVFISLTKNMLRQETNIANTRPFNVYGHIIELMPPAMAGGFNHTVSHFRWDIFLQGGNPQEAKHQAYYHSAVSANGWLANPDNLAFDAQGRIWICTDGQMKSINQCEGLYAADCEGGAKGQTKLFFTAPIGAEITGPAFTPDSKTLFLSIQHPGEESSFDKPSTRWPDFREDIPPRPSVIAITHQEGKIIGSR